ncbi:MAG: deoxyribose-phosphate aldolase [Phaeodactylibacter sp.]|nr:deoxyribose-phosphate aldolase [Phaeodactylibacter sp.]
MNLASYIDLNILKPDCRLQDIEQACKEAALYGFAAVCVPPFYVKQAAGLLEGRKVKVSTVVGFPMGYHPTPAKVEEIKRAIDDGAEEVEGVVNLCAVKNNNWNFVANDIDSMATAAHLKGKSIKIILETGLLSEEEIKKLCQIAVDSQVEYLKAATGYNGQDDTIEAVMLLKGIVGDKARIKASGAIRSKWDAERFIEAGAQRVGLAAGLAIFS